MQNVLKGETHFIPSVLYVQSYEQTCLLNYSSSMRTIHFTNPTTSTSSPQRAMSCLQTSASGRNSGATFSPAMTESQWKERQTISHHPATSPMYAKANFTFVTKKKKCLPKCTQCFDTFCFTFRLVQQCNKIPEERRFALPLKSVYMRQIDHMVGLF